MSNQRQAPGAPTADSGVVPPMPVPMSFAVQVPRMNDGSHAVALSLFSPTGQFVTFLSAEGAQALSKDLDQAATQARVGLIVAGAVDAGEDPALAALKKE